MSGVDRPRTLVAVPVAVAVAVIGAVLASAGCTSGRSTVGDDAARTALEQLEPDVDRAVLDLLPDLAEAFGVQAAAGRASYDVCGTEPTPSGARYVSRPQFRGATMSPEAAVENAVSLLEPAGWSIERPANPAIVVARRDDLEVRVDASEVAISVEVSSACVEAPSDLARTFADRASKDVPLQ